MASATASTRNDPRSAGATTDAGPESGPGAAVIDGRPAIDDSDLRWSVRWSLTGRILAVNLFALLMLAGGVLYLDQFRDRLIDQRREQLRTQTMLMATAFGEAMTAGGRGDVAELAARFGPMTKARLRIYGSDGSLVLDSWKYTGPTFRLRDPNTEPWRKEAARFLDRIIEFIGSAPRLPAYQDAAGDRRAEWPEAEAAARGIVADELRRAPDRTVIATAAAPIPRPALGPPPVLHVTIETRDITRVVRSERSSSFVVFLGVLGLSLLLSSFLARTIVRPLRRLALAAQRVRLGRAREVTVPRFAKRRDEIGELARAVSDMTQALRQRMDATEAFAADVAHELKNPLASLRSAVESLEQVKDPGLQAQLLDVIRDDVHRLDRLITDISNASRLDAELARARFHHVDLGQMVATLVRLYEASGLPRGVEIAFARPEPGTAIVMGDESRLGQVVHNLIDNAISFSPDAGVVCVTVARSHDHVVLRVDDDGPGIPPESREDIFKRFYSLRPDGEAFGKHSGLGLAIAKAVIDAHDGSIKVLNRERDGQVAGARFVVSLPAAE